MRAESDKANDARLGPVRKPSLKHRVFGVPIEKVEFHLAMPYVPITLRVISAIPVFAAPRTHHSRSETGYGSSILPSRAHLRVAQSGIAPALGAGDRKFESCRAD